MFFYKSTSISMYLFSKLVEVKIKKQISSVVVMSINIILAVFMVYLTCVCVSVSRPSTLKASRLAVFLTFLMQIQSSMPSLLPSAFRL